MAKQKQNKKTRKIPIGSAASEMLTLEPRIMLDAAALATGAEMVVDASPTVADTTGIQLPDNMEVQPDIRDEAKNQESVNKDTEEQIELQPLGVSSDEQAELELVIVDKSIADYESLIAGLVNKDDASLAQDRMIEIIEIEPGSDGILQISNALSNYDNVSAVHILSHADQGQLHLGDSVLSSDNLADYSDVFSGWSSHLTDGADILLYGCDVAEGEAGIQFVNDIAELTGADVAASNDTTGNAEQNANWQLEYHTGAVEAASPFAAQTIENFQGTLDATLDITKDSDVTERFPGEVVTYTVEITNNGTNDAAINVNLTDALDANLIYNEDINIMGENDTTDNSSIANGIDVDIASVDPNESYTITFSATVNPFLAVDQQIFVNNQAMITGEDAGDMSAIMEQSAQIAVEVLAPISVTKSANVASAGPNDTITYTVSITNNTGNTITGVEVSDVLDPTNALQLVDDSQLNTIYSIDGGATQDVIYTADVIDPVLAFIESVTNTATVASNEYADVISNEQVVIIDADPLLELTKSPDNETVIAGGTIEYTVTVANTGNQEAVDIDFSDVLDPAVFASGSVMTNIGSILPGESTDVIVTGVLFEFGVLPGFITQTFNTATASPGDNSNVVETDSNTVTTNINNAAPLSAVKSADVASAGVNDIITYSIIISNNTDDTTISNIEITDIMDPNNALMLIDDSELNTSYTLEGGQSIEVEYTAQVIDPVLAFIEDVSNTATIANDFGSPIQTNEVTILIDADPVLTVVKTADKDVVDLNSDVTYTITVTNIGDQEAVDIEVTDVLDPTVFASGSLSEMIASLLPGESQQFSFVGTVLDFGELPLNVDTVSNTAVVSPGDMSNITEMNSNTLFTGINQLASLSIDKSVDLPFAQAGDELEYTITITNDSPFLASNVDVTDILGSFLINPNFISPPGASLPNLATNVDLAPQDSLFYMFTVDIDPAIPDTQSFVQNTVTVSGDNVATTDVTATTSLSSDITVFKVANVAGVEPGDPITYTIYFQNLTGDTITNVQLIDDLVAELIPNDATVSSFNFGDTYSTVGNTEIQVSGTSSFVDRPSVKVAGTVFDNDTVFWNGAPTLVSFTSSSANGGIVNVTADGSFTYTPSQLFNGADTFTYTALDPTGLVEYVGEVTINVDGEVWYVDDSATPGGNGTSTSPFTTLAAISGTGGIDNVDSIVYLLDGNYSETFVLENGQQLLGEGVDLITGGFFLHDGSQAEAPVITSNGNALSATLDNTIRGLTVGDTNGYAIIGTNLNTLTIDEVEINGTGALLSVTNTNLQADFFDLSSTSSNGTAIFLSGLTSGSSLTTPNTTITDTLLGNSGIVLISNDTANLDFGVTNITNSGTPGAVAVSLSGNTGGTYTFDSFTSSQFNVGISVGNNSSLTTNFGVTDITNSAGSGTNGINIVNNSSLNFDFTSVTIDGFTASINVSSTTSSTIDFGPTVITSNLAAAIYSVNLASNTSTNFNFDSLSINTPNLGGFSATSGGTINLNDPAVIAASGGFASALVLNNVNGTTNSLPGFTFETVNYNGFGSGINLDNLTDSFTITGDGSTPGSGGVITLNLAGNGVEINSALNVSLSYLNITGVGVLSNGVFASGVDGLTVQNSVITNHNNGVFATGAVKGTYNILNNTINNVSNAAVSITLEDQGTPVQSAVTLNINGNNVNIADSGIVVTTNNANFLAAPSSILFDIGNNLLQNITSVGIQVGNLDFGSVINGTIHDNNISTPTFGIVLNNVDGIPNAILTDVTMTVAVQGNAINSGLTGFITEFEPTGASQLRITENTFAGFQGVSIIETAFFGFGRHIVDILDNTFVSLTFDTGFSTPNPNSGISFTYNNTGTGTNFFDAAVFIGTTPVATLPSYPPGFDYSPLSALGGENPTGTAASITLNEVHSLVDAAKQYWSNSTVSAEKLARLDSLEYVITDLPDGFLAAHDGDTILIDHNAANYGWFVDSTPFDAVEFNNPIAQMDLLTVLIHEMGHELDFVDVAYDANAITVMSDALDVGQRYLPPQDTIQALQNSVVGPLLAPQLTTTTPPPVITVEQNTDVTVLSLQDLMGQDPVMIDLGSINDFDFHFVTLNTTVVDVVPAGIDGEILTNFSTLVFDQEPQGVNSNLVAIPIDAEPILVLNKTPNFDAFLPGETITYTISAENIGNQHAVLLTVTDITPANSTYNAGASDPNWINNGDGTLTYNFTPLNVGEGAFSAEIAFDIPTSFPINTAGLSNTATLVGAGLPFNFDQATIDGVTASSFVRVIFGSGILWSYDSQYYYDLGRYESLESLYYVPNEQIISINTMDAFVNMTGSRNPAFYDPVFGPVDFVGERMSLGNVAPWPAIEQLLTFDYDQSFYHFEPANDDAKPDADAEKDVPAQKQTELYDEGYQTFSEQLETVSSQFEQRRAAFAKAVGSL